MISIQDRVYLWYSTQIYMISYYIKRGNIPRMVRFPWFLSFLVIFGIYLMGNKSIWGPIEGIITQIFYTYYVIKTDQKGFVLAGIVITLMYVRMLWLWA